MRDPNVTRRECRRATKAGHEACWRPRARNPCSSSLASLDDLVNAVGDEPMSLPVDAHRCVSSGRLDEAERLVVLLVDPVPDVLDAVGILLGQVRLVGMGDVRSGGTIGELLVDVYEKRQGHISCV